MTTNPYEDSARARKVIQLLSVIPAGRTQAENDLIALLFEGLDAKQRGVYEVLADLKHPASDETWRQTLSAVRARHVPGDGGAIDRRTDVRRPDFSAAIAKNHRAHYYRDEDRACVPCQVLEDSLNAAFDQGVSAAIRAVGL